ncbi:hypothetical protein ACH5RR_020488 [Cinchona calisaya]|uniref:Ionotropic glutamate receptor C-terminal domain-containing protein n=1 Tax=Cinchona calisaya TaxID=153742 RepID=A0ABD2ZFS2_9GENT
MKIKRICTTEYTILFVFCSFLTHLSPSSCNGKGMENEIEVGVILDMGSWTGKTIHSCITMAISDFYASNDHYKTRIVLHTRDSKGDSMHAISAAVDLLENINVQAIIGPETSLETKFLAVLGDKAKVPIFSFASIISSPGTYPFLVQIKQDVISQFKGIATILNSYNWRDVFIIYEDSDDGREVLPHLLKSFQEADVRIVSAIAISPFSTGDQIHNELNILMTRKPNVFIVHMSPPLASLLFQSAKRLGMMKAGFAWIATDKTMNQFHSMDSEVIESSQGVVGLKAYIPLSSKLIEVSSRWRKEFYFQNPSVLGSEELDVLGIWAYDTIWALAESIEKLRFGDTRLLNQITETRLTGLSGNFQILDGKLQSEAYVIVNVIGKGERRVGYWTPTHGMVKDMQQLVTGRSLSTMPRGLEDIVWPGGTAVAPKGLFMPTGGRKLRIAVINNHGFEELVRVHIDPQTNATSFNGFCTDVFDTAIKSLDYPVPYEFIPYVNESGGNLGTYSDLIYEVYLKNYDGAVGDITITANRSLYADFTLPYTDVGVGTIAKRENNDMWVFSKPLSVNLWLASAVFFVLTGLVVWAIEHPTNQEFQGSVVQQIGTILWFGFSTLVYAHREKLTSNLSRLVVIVWLFVVLILTSSYTATLSSMLTLQQIQFGSAGQYLGIQGGSPLQCFIANNLNFEDSRLQPYYSPEAYADALSRGSKKGGVAAIVDEIPYIMIFLGKSGADYAMVASQSTTSGLGFVFQKDSPLLSNMSRAILKLREEGKLGMMENYWFKSKSSYIPADAAAAPRNTLNLQSFSGLFLISCVSCVLALLIHITCRLKKLKFKNAIINLLDGENVALVLRYLAPRNGNAVEPVNNKHQELQANNSIMEESEEYPKDYYSQEPRRTTSNPTSSSYSASTTSVHVTALDGLVNVNSLFTIAVFVGLSLTTPNQHSLENSACDASVDVAKKLLVFEVVSFSFFLFSSLIAQGLKLAINLLNSKDVDEAFRAHISLRILRFGMLGSAIGSVMGCLFLMLSMVNVIEIRLGMLSCGSKSTVHAVTALIVLVTSALLVYISTAVYAFLH